MTDKCTCGPKTRSNTKRPCSFHPESSEDIFLEHLRTIKPRASSSSKNEETMAEQEVTIKTLQDLTLALANSTQQQDNRFDRFLTQMEQREHNREGPGEGNQERQPRSRATLKPPKHFKGTDDPHIGDFFQQFDRYVKFNKLTDDERTLAFPSCLDGPALQYYESLPNEVRTNFDNLKNAFNEKFEPARMRVFRRAKLNSRKMSPTESLEDYTLAICNESRRLELTDAETMQIFIQGLSNKLKEYVLLQNPATLQDARNAAESKDFALKTIKDSTNMELNTMIPKLQELIQGQQSENKSYQHHNLERMEELMMKVNALERRQQPPQQRSKHKTNITCYRCKRDGHKFKDCYATRTKFGEPIQDPGSQPQQRQNNNNNQNSSWRKLPERPRHHPNPGYDVNRHRPPFQGPQKPIQPPYDPFKSRDRRIRFNDPNRNEVNMISTRDHRNHQRPTNWMKTNQSNRRKFESPTATQEFYQVTEPSPLMFLKGKIFGSECKMLIDTGASISCINKEYWNEVKPKNYPVTLTPYQEVATFSGGGIQVHGETIVPIELGDYEIDQQLIIIPCTHDVILGRDFMKMTKAVINLNSDDITIFNHHTLPMICTMNPEQPRKLDWSPMNASDESATDVIKVRLKTTTILPPKKHVSEITVLSKTAPYGTTLYLEKNPVSEFEIVAPCVTEYQGREMWCTIYNPTDQQMKIPCETVIGYLDIVTDITSMIEGTTPEVNNIEPTDLAPLSFNLEKSNLSRDKERQMQNLLKRYRPVFAATDQELGRTSVVKHHIELENKTPIRQRPYPTSHENKIKIKQHIDKMLDMGIIEPSTSPFSSPVILVKKAGKNDRFCVDYRKLNAVTHKDSYPLPKIQDTLDALHGAVYFSTLDMRSGYWQIELDEESKELTAFTTYAGLFHFNVVPFGITTAPSSFQRLMECILRGLNWEICLIYIDDIIVFSRSFSKHLQDLSEVFNRLLAANIKLRPEKCSFARESVNYLGHVVSKNGVSPDSEKTKLIKSFPVPKNPKQIKQFLGLAGYYRRFVENFSKIALPMTRLLRKDEPFKWDQSCQKSFDELKTRLQSPPILAYPDFTKSFDLYVDASGTAIGMILGQVQDGKERVIAYGGRTLNKAERNYSCTEREALACLEAIKTYQPYIHGRKFTIHTDHNALRWLMRLKSCVGRLGRWSLQIQQHDFDIVHRPGKVHNNADVLSRHPLLVNSVDLLSSSRPNISDLQAEDEDLKYLIHYLVFEEIHDNDPSPETTLIKADNHTIDEDGLLYHIYVPESGRNSSTFMQLAVPRSLREEILTAEHDQGGHFGVSKTFDRVHNKYYWPGLLKDCKEWVRSCHKCNIHKPSTGSKKAPMQRLEEVGPFVRVGVDIVGPFPVTDRGNKYILVAIDHFTRWVEGYALPNMETVTLARTLVDEFICRHGAPDMLLSDRGKNFISSLMKEICRLINTKKLNTSSYHPATNGKCERVNGVIVKRISMFVSKNQKDWDVHLPGALFAIRTTPSASTNETPFFLVYGRKPRLPGDVALFPSKTLAVNFEQHKEDLVKTLKVAHDMAAGYSLKQAEKMEKYYNKGTAPAKFEVGDKVLVSKLKRDKGLSPKLGPKFTGPYLLKEKLSDVLFKLTELNGKNLGSPIHVNRLKKYVDESERTVGQENTEIPETALMYESSDEEPSDIEEEQRKTQPRETSEPEIKFVSDDRVQQVQRTESPEKIIDHRRRKGKMEYLVKGKNETMENSIWVTKDMLDLSLVESYLGNQRHSINNINFQSRASFDRLNAAAIIVLIILNWVTANNALQLGEIYDCTKVKPKGIFRYPDIRNCTVPPDDSTRGVQTFKAEIMHESPKYTPVTMFHCSKFEAILTCSEEFFGNKKKYRKTKILTTTAKECRDIWFKKAFNNRRLKKLPGNGIWELDVTEKYNCKWMSRKSAYFVHYRITEYKGYIIGGQKYIHQAVTKTKCNHVKKFCRPEEDSTSVIIWNLPANLDENIYHSKGVHTVKMMGDMVLVRELKIGGTVILTKQDSYLLDNGYLIQKKAPSKTTVDTILEYTKTMRRYIPNNEHWSLVEAHLAALYQTERLNLIDTWNTICKMEQRFQKIERFILSTFPDSSTNFFYKKGHHLQASGDGLIIGECFPLRSYSIAWDRMHNGTCYTHFPVYIPYAKQLYFLNLPSRSLLHTSNKIDCSERPSGTYIVDELNHAYAVGPTGNIVPAKLSFLVHKKPFNTEELISGFDSQLYEPRPPRLDQYSILQLITATSQTITDMHETVTSDPSGNFIESIGKSLGHTLMSLGNSGSMIIKSLGHAIHDSIDGVSDLDKGLIQSLANASAVVLPAAGHALKDAGEGVSGIFSSAFGGIWGLVRTVLIALLLLGFGYLIITKNPNILQKLFLHSTRKKIKENPPQEMVPLNKLDQISEDNSCPLHDQTAKDTKVIYPNLQSNRLSAPPYVEVQ